MKLSLLAVVAASAVTAEAAFLGPSSFVARPTSVGRLHQNPTITRSTSFLKVAETTSLSMPKNDDDDDDMTTTTKATTNQEAFKNEGPFSFMTNFLFLHEDGKSMAYAIPMDADPNQKASPEEVAQQKKDYSANLMNIGLEERDRRRNAGDLFTILTGVYIVWASLIADQGEFQGHVLRFLSFLPLFFASGFQLSADEGL